MTSAAQNISELFLDPNNPKHWQGSTITYTFLTVYPSYEITPGYKEAGGPVQFSEA